MYKIVNKSLKALAFIGALVTASEAASAQTIKVLIVQEDSDKTSLLRNGRIQSAVLNSWNQTMHGPAYQQIMRQYGISGMDVYDETAVSLNFYEQARHRRSPQEIITLARQIQNPRMDVMVLYTLYAKALKNPYTRVRTLQMSMNYRALSVKDGRYLGGGNLDIDTSGGIITGCAAGLHGQRVDAHCVNEFVAQHAERLARSAGNRLSLQLAALLGQKYGKGSHKSGYDSTSSGASYKGGAKDGANAVISGNGYGNRHKGCGNLPVTFIVKYRGFSSRQINFIEGNMENWKCKLDLDAVNSSFPDISFSYKTRSNQQRLLRNIRLMTELMGVVVEAKIHGHNEIIVSSLALREN